MYSQIDRIIFPNWCEVYQLASHQCVYPIFKNGTNSLKFAQQKNNWKILVNEQIKKVDTITVYWRPAFERFVSGVNSYIQWEQRDHEFLNQKNILHFVKKYLFLDRHFCPQYFWLINLNRYMNKDAKILIKPLDDINDIVNNLNLKPNWELPDAPHDPVSSELKEELSNFKESLFLKMDDKLFDNFKHTEVEFDDIKNTLIQGNLWNVLG